MAHGGSGGGGYSGSGAKRGVGPVPHVSHNHPRGTAGTHIAARTHDPVIHRSQGSRRVHRGKSTPMPALVSPLPQLAAEPQRIAAANPPPAVPQRQPGLRLPAILRRSSWR